METPKCRICGKTEWVGVYDPEHLERAICVECCPKATHWDEESGHQFYYESGEGQMCQYCGIRRNDTDYDYYDGDENE